LVSSISSKQHIRTPIPRCCPAHLDWRTLAGHLFADFSDVPTQALLEELRRARYAGEFFDLSAADTLDCAELMVRYRVLIANGQITPALLDGTSAVSVPQLALPRQPAQCAGVLSGN
jgi:hypothetical protein